MKQVSISPKTWLTLRFIAFPLATLVPFFVIRYTEAHCYSAPNETGMSLGGTPIVFGIILWLVIGIFLVASFLQRKSEEKRQEQRSFIIRQLLVSIVSIAATIPVYLWMRQHSQNGNFPSWWCDSAGRLHGSVPDTMFGIGITPSAVVLMALVFLAVPSIKYYMLRFSRKRVSGIKKEDLFQ